MSYTKNIAVIRGLKSGFSSDGGALSGLVKAEQYGNSLKIEATLINFAPLTEGKYVIALSDGKEVCIADGLTYEGSGNLDTSGGFAALICFVNKEVLPVAAAVCGDFHFAIPKIKEEIEREERPRIASAGYDDEALAKENYYEYEQADKDGGAVRENPPQEEDGQNLRENEAAESSVNEKGGLAHGECFFARMKDEIEKVLSSYPEERELEETVENSRWVRINYGEGKFYVFGVIYGEEKPEYVCYGVPATDTARPPESLAPLASFIPAPSGEGGYWVMYQDANTGAVVKLEEV